MPLFLYLPPAYHTSPKSDRGVEEGEKEDCRRHHHPQRKHKTRQPPSIVKTQASRDMAAIEKLIGTDGKRPPQAGKARQSEGIYIERE